ncbi:MAG: 3'(2'),5'-bisphosphate nucleotidase CysQ [Pyrinomonadaceae bacterium]|nr:3'(2'),5'-bisphosphate nucleotidase CysQ [Pyrinomonadaceae bacterium]
MENNFDLSRELEIAVALARNADAAIMEIYEAGFVAEVKIGLDDFSEPVTIADRKASRIIVDGLKSAFPDDGVLSEEEPDDDDRLTKNRVWFVDPIDGTNGFISKSGDFAIQIGLAIDGESVLGVVLESARNKLFHAVKNRGTFLEIYRKNIKTRNDAKRLQASDKIDFSEMTIATSRSHRVTNTTRIVESLTVKNEIQRGSVGVKVGLICEQVADLYVHLSPRSKQWDTCAPEIILREAGGELTDLFGERIIYNTKDVQNLNGIVATNGASHSKVVKNIKPLLSEFGRLRVVQKS